MQFPLIVYSLIFLLAYNNVFSQISTKHTLMEGPPIPSSNKFQPIKLENHKSVSNTPAAVFTINVNEGKQQAGDELNEDFNKKPISSSVNKIITGNYQHALEQLQEMVFLNNNAFSITDAIYLTENTYFNQKLSLTWFNNAIKSKVELCKDIMRKEKLDSSNNLSKNYAIQKLFSDNIDHYDIKTKTVKTLTPFTYDFDDYKGDSQWEKMFVSKLLFTGKGQCHSLPLMYLVLAEHLGAKAYLSLAPEHYYIQFYGKKGNAYNFETTNGKLVSDSWLMQSGFINTNAIRNKTYMDTLGRKKLIASLMTDLLLGYIHKYGEDHFTTEISENIKQLDPDNLNVLMLEANKLTGSVMKMIRAAGSPPLDKLPEHPVIYQQYQHLLTLYNRIDDLGYQAMPEEAYQDWLKSVEMEKQRQEDLRIEGQLLFEMKLQSLNNLK